MNELAINIEYLLLTRNCVVVPGLGAFTTRVFASQWLEDEEIFLPPVRHIRFNADIFQDPEEVFVHSLADIYSTTMEEAQAECDKLVASFHKALVTEGTVDFGSIGLFTLEDDAEITMSPYECGVTSPDYYGLDTLHFPLLASLPEEMAEPEETSTMTDQTPVKKAAEVAASEPSAEEQSSTVHVKLPEPRVYVADDKHIIIRLNRAFVRYTMVAAASVLLFFLLGPSVKDHEAAQGVNEATTNVLLPTAKPAVKSEKKVVAKEAEQIKVQPVVQDSMTIVAPVEVAPVAEVKPAEEVSKTVEEKVQQTGDNSQVISQLRGSYSIVLASQVSLKNAKAFVQRLEEKDVHAIIFDNGKMLRVVIDGFATQAEAYNVNSYLHNIDKELGSTWVMKI